MSFIHFNGLSLDWKELVEGLIEEEDSEAIGLLFSHFSRQPEPSFGMSDFNICVNSLRGYKFNQGGYYSRDSNDFYCVDDEYSKISGKDWRIGRNS